jgi:hypothetical protein
MGKYNINSIKRKVLKSRAFTKGATRKVNQSLIKAKSLMLNDFDSHPVSKEISQGAEGRNLSNTLGGYGNLFSFIGFGSGSSPITDVRNILAQYPDISNIRMSGSKLVVDISIPTLNDLALASRMPWESGRSWVSGVETGISGFSNYMYNVFGEGSKSRSGKAVQASKQIRPGSYRPVPYVSEIIKKLVVNITAGIK